MSAFRVLRLAVIGFCVLMAALVAVAFIESEILPPVLRDWNQSRSPSLLAVVLGLPAIVGAIVGSLALLAQKRWGLWVHLAASACGLIAGMVMGPLVASAATVTIDSLLLIVSGLIYGLAFFTDALRADEEKKPNKAPEPTPLPVTPPAEPGVAPGSGVAHL